jgi:hypothetical protein
LSRPPRAAAAAASVSPQALERLVGLSLPRLHVISDVHLEKGPYEFPVGLEYDILVAAGDIGPLDVAIPWLASVGKPVVYVLGNHEFYYQEFSDVVRQARHLARDTQVHVLARDAVIIQGVRFLGTTLWTNFGDWNQDLVHKALRHMFDYSKIEAGKWWAIKSNERAARRLADKIGLLRFTPDKFSPAIAYLEHQKDVEWLRTMLRQDYEDGPTVVVTHHSPSFESLRAYGVDECYLTPDGWHSREHAVVRVAAYASPLLAGALKSSADDVDLWVHGHLHKALDVCDAGVRIVANPRGYLKTALTQRDVEVGKLLGYHVTEEDVKRSQAAHAADPFRGDGVDFNERLIVQFGEGQAPALARSVAKRLERLDALIADTETLLPFVCRDHSVPIEAVHRAFAANVDEFASILQDIQRKEGRGLDGDSMGMRNREAPAYPPTSTVTRTVFGVPTRKRFREQLELMIAWRAWVAQLPFTAARALLRWARLATQALEFLKKQGVQARVVLPRPRALRVVSFDDLELIVAEGAARPDLDVLLDKKFNPGRGAREVMISVRTSPLRDGSASRIKSLAEVRAMVRQLRK